MKAVNISFVLLLTQLVVSSQNNEYLNLEKYWYYRDRLKYFVIPGSGQGESHIAGIRNLEESSALDWGQHTVYLGYYIGVLATEYALLNHYGQLTQNTYNELDLALNMFIHQMDECETKICDPSHQDTFDGYFMRNNQYCEFFNNEHLKALNENLLPSDITYYFTKPGKPFYVNKVGGCDDGVLNPESMSQDEVIGLFKGLLLVYKYLPYGSGAWLKSKIIIRKVIEHMHNDSNVLGFNWLIYEPCNNTLVGTGTGGGSITRQYAIPFIEIYSMLGYDPASLLQPYEYGSDYIMLWQTWQLS